MPNDAARVAALLAGRRRRDRERADRRTSKRVRSTPRFRLEQKVSGARSSSPRPAPRAAAGRRPTRPAGRSTRNPFKDARVRQGAVDGDQPPGDRRARDGGRGDAGGEPVRRRSSATSPEAQAGAVRPGGRARSCSPRRAIPSGFAIDARGARTTATSTTRRSPRPSRRCSPASASTRRSQTMPLERLLPARRASWSSLHCSGWGSYSGELALALRSLLATYDADQGHRRVATAAATPTRRWTSWSTQALRPWTTRKREALSQQEAMTARDGRHGRSSRSTTR